MTLEIYKPNIIKFSNVIIANLMTYVNYPVLFEIDYISNPLNYKNIVTLNMIKIQNIYN